MQLIPSQMNKSQKNCIWKFKNTPGDELVPVLQLTVRSQAWREISIGREQDVPENASVQSQALRIWC